MIDTHCHVNLKHFEDDFEGTLARAISDGVTALVNIGFDKTTLQETIALVDKYPFIYGVAGLHPHDAQTYGEELEKEISAALDNPRFIACGEIGLDFYRDLSPREAQYDVFRRMIHLAHKKDKPIVIHCRDAFDEVIDTLAAEGNNYRGIFHAFAGSAEQAGRVLDLGFHIGIGGAVSFKSSQLARTMETLPLNRIVLETDSPYLTPQPYRSKRNEPAYVAHVAQVVARIRHLEPKEIIRLTTENFARAMGIAREALPGPVYKIGDTVYIHTAHAGVDELRGWAAEVPTDDVKELVISDFAEPLERLDDVKEVAVFGTEREWFVRLNTTGMGNQLAGRDVTPELAEVLDEIVVPFYGGSASLHDRSAPEPVGEEGFEIMRDFVRCSVAADIQTICEFIAVPRFNPEPCKKLARDLGAQYDIRMYRS